MNGPEPMNRRDGKPRWDVAIVLGARLRQGGQPTATLERRTRRGVDLLHRGLAGQLILTGGGDGVRAEAEAMAEIALREGIGPERIHCDPLAKDTLENAMNAITIARSKGWESGVVVTDTYHLPRARMAFHRLGWPVSGSGVGADAWSLRHLIPSIREMAALPAYVIRLERARRSAEWSDRIAGGK